MLVERYLEILREGDVTPREIVAITFTEKAAAEMKERIIKELPPQKTREGIGQIDSLEHFVKIWVRHTFQLFTLFAHVF